MKSRDSDVPLVCEVFTHEEILATNRRHDREYGWDNTMPRCYTNPRRLPETEIGGPWVEQGEQNSDIKLADS